MLAVHGTRADDCWRLPYRALCRGFAGLDESRRFHDNFEPQWLNLVA